MTRQLLAVDLALAVGLTALWLGAGILLATTSSVTRRTAMVVGGLVAGAVLATAGRIAVVAALWGDGWWFVQEKVLLSLPLVVVPAVVAVAVTGPPLLAVARGRATDVGPLPRTALLVAGYGAAIGPVVQLLVGYPATVVSGLVLVTVLVVLSVVTWLVLNGRARPMVVTALGVVCLVAAGVPVAVQQLTDADGHAHGGAGVSVADLELAAADPSAPVRHFELTARQQAVRLVSGQTVQAWTFGSLPGPTLAVTQGDVVEVVLHNRDITAGVTIHWHGYDVPNADDGVAGMTQDAVLPGGSFTYRFVAKDAGTYWYHTHQDSAIGVPRGLYGLLVVRPKAAAAVDSADVAVPVHTIGGAVLVGGSDRLDVREVAAGAPVRLRLVNTDSEPHRFSVTGPAYRVAAVDGRDLHGPTERTGGVLRVPAGGRYDVTLTMPVGGVRVGIEGAPQTGVVLVTPGAAHPRSALFREGTDLDLLSYGTSSTPAPTTFDRSYTVVLDRQFRFVHGTPTYAYTVNGAVDPHVAPLVVHKGDLVKITVVNRGTDTHPMHPHGHHVRVLSRNGVAVTGSPLWLDTFDVQPGEVWVVALKADNPGIWLAHCHNLDHATNGMVLHLVYEGVTTPFTMDHGNSAE